MGVVEGVGEDDEAVVAGGGEGVGHIFEDSPAVVVDGAGFAVHQAGVAVDGHAEAVADALVAEADAQEGCVSCEGVDDVVGDAPFAGGAWAGGDDDVGGVESEGIFDGDAVVADDVDA